MSQITIGGDGDVTLSLDGADPAKDAYLSRIFPRLKQVVERDIPDPNNPPPGRLKRDEYIAARICPTCYSALERGACGNIDCPDYGVVPTPEVR